MKRHWPAVACVAIYWIAVAALLAMSVRRTGGRLVYPLDDAYIHMAMAKNAVQHHVWGVTRHEFTSASSSPLWTLLLTSTYALAGVRDAAPLLLNAVAGTGIVLTVYVLLRRRQAHPRLAFLVLTAIVVVAPLPTLTLTGMEHTAHALVTLWFVCGAATSLASREAPAPRLAALAILAALCTGLRYEGVFAAGIVTLLFAVTRRWLAAAAVCAGAALPIVVYGAWSAAHGWMVLPNSVLLKGHLPALSSSALLRFASGSPALHGLIAAPHMLLLVIAMLLLLIVLMVAAPRWDEDRFLLAIGAGAIVAHMQFAATGWLFRYEAYLVVLALSVAGVIAAAWADRVSALMPDGARLPRYAVLCALVVVFGFPFASRGLSALRTAPVATSNIFEQQYQMGLFLDRFYRDRHVAVNDIGAVAYLADVRLLDLYGLATLETARLHRRGAYSPDAVSTLAAERDTAVAIIYPSWFGEYGGVPPQWTRVGDWKVRDNVILGDSVVSFYAVKPDERAPLAANLRQFAADLPADVSQSGEYRVAAGSK